MSHEIWWITVITGATFIVALAILAILVWRGGRSRETAITLAAVKKISDSVEEMRRQNSTEHYVFGKLARWIISELTRIVGRLGFLANKDAPEPPLQTPKPSKDDIR